MPFYFYFYNCIKYPFFFFFLVFKKLQVLVPPLTSYAILNSHQNHFFQVSLQQPLICFLIPFFCCCSKSPRSLNVSYVFVEHNLALKEIYILFLYFSLFCVSHHQSNILSSWKTGELMCVSFGFFKGAGTALSQRAPRERIRGPEFLASLTAR